MRRIESDLCNGESGLSLLLLLVRRRPTILIDEHLIGIQIGFIQLLDGVLSQSKVTGHSMMRAAIQVPAKRNVFDEMISINLTTIAMKTFIVNLFT